MNSVVYIITLLIGSVLLALFAPWYTVVAWCGLLSWIARARPSLALAVSFVLPLAIWLSLIYSGPYASIANLLGELLGIAASLTPAISALILAIPSALVGWAGALLRKPKTTYVFAD